MNENIDLTKILEGCEGIELHHAIYGRVRLVRTNYPSDYPIILEVLDSKDSNRETGVTIKGKFVDNDFGECLLFPSKEQRDWSKFVRPIKEGTPMMVSCNKKKWSLMFYKCFGAGMHRVHLRDGEPVYDYEYVIPFAKFDPNDIEGSIEKYNIQK